MEACLARESDDQAQQTQQQMLLAALLAKAPSAAADASDDDEEDKTPAPAPAPAAPNPLAASLAGGGVAVPPAGKPPLPPVPPSAAGAPPGTHYAAGPGAPLLIRDNQGAEVPGGFGGLFGALASPFTGLAKAIGIGGAPPAINLPAAAAAPGAGAPGAPGAASDISGKASDIGTAEQREIYSARQQLRAQEQTLRAQIAGASSPEVAKIYADQLGKLSAYDQQLETAYVGTLKEPDTWTTKIDPQNGLQYQENATTGERKYTTAAEPKIIEGPPDPFTGAKQSYSVTYENGKPVLNPLTPSAAATGAPAAAAGINYDLKGPDFLGQFPPQIQSAILDYHSGKAIPTGNPRSGLTQNIKMWAQKYGDDIGDPVDDTIYAARKKMRTDLASSQPSSTGGQLQFGDTTMSHLANASDNAVDLGNVDPLGWTALSHGLNYMWQQSTAQAGKVNALLSSAGTYGADKVKFLTGGPGAEPERTEFARSLSGVLSPTELADKLEAEANLFPARFEAIHSKVAGVLGEEEAAKYAKMPPTMQASYDKIMRNVAILRGQTAPEQSGAATATTGQPSAQRLSPIDAAKLKPGMSFIGEDGIRRTVR
jgi:hypothetical protein